MKNIHILPTDKPSRLCFRNYYFLNKDNITEYSNVEFKNIYIINDEEIKEGDWFILDMSHSSHSNELHQLGDDKWSKTGGIHFCEGNSWVDSCKKIILTTDQDLIKDGIQAIDDEFLEWFVKNPSCEKVEVKKEILYEHKDTYRSYPSECKNLTKTKVNYYLSILPKEEPKQCNICKMYPRLEGTNKCESCYSVVRHFLEQYSELKDNLLPDLKMKQETLEEAVDKYTPLRIEQKAFIAGAEYQAKRMYSEKEVLEIIRQYALEEHLITSSKPDIWFEQFKKK